MTDHRVSKIENGKNLNPVMYRSHVTKICGHVNVTMPLRASHKSCKSIMTCTVTHCMTVTMHVTTRVTPHHTMWGHETQDYVNMTVTYGHLRKMVEESETTPMTHCHPCVTPCHIHVTPCHICVTPCHVHVIACHTCVTPSCECATSLHNCDAFSCKHDTLSQPCDMF